MNVAEIVAQVVDQMPMRLDKYENLMPSHQTDILLAITRGIECGMRQGYREGFSAGVASAGAVVSATMDALAP